MNEEEGKKEQKAEIGSHMMIMLCLKFYRIAQKEI